MTRRSRFAVVARRLWLLLCVSFTAGTCTILAAQSPTAKGRITVQTLPECPADPTVRLETGSRTGRNVSFDGLEVTRTYELETSAGKTKVRIPAGSTDLSINLDCNGRQVELLHLRNTPASSGSSVASATVVRTQSNGPAVPELETALQGRAGVSMQSFGVARRPIINGLGGRDVVALDDGIEGPSMASELSDAIDLINLAKADQIEVVFGPPGFLQGAGAIAGTINVHSSYYDLERTHDGKPSTRGSIEGGVGFLSRRQSWTASRVETTWRNWSALVSGGLQRFDDYRVPHEQKNCKAMATTEVANSDLRSEALTGLLRYDGNDWFLTIGNDFVSSGYGLPEAGGCTRQQNNNHQYKPRVTVGLVRGDWKYSATLAYGDWQNHRSRFLPVLEQANENVIERDIRSTLVAEGRAENKWFDVGARFRKNSYSEVFQGNRLEVQQKVVAGFGGVHHEWVRGSFEAGVRAERSQDENNAGEQSLPHRTVSAEGGGLLNFKKGLVSLGGSFTSFRRPASLTERFAFRSLVGGVFERGDPSLDPEKGNGGEVNLRWNGIREPIAKIGAFYYRIDNFIYLALTGLTQNGLAEASYRQGRGEFRGIRLEANRPVWNGFSFKLNGGWTARSVRETAAGRREVTIPEAIEIVAVLVPEDTGKTFQLPQVTWTAARRDTQIASVTVARRTSSKGLLSILFPITPGKGPRFDIELRNVFNRSYSNPFSIVGDRLAEPGRSLHITYRYSFP